MQMSTEPRVLPDLARIGAARFGSRTALGSLSSPTALTYQELLERTRRAAAGLRARSLTMGDRVLLVAEGRPEWPVALFAILEAGGIAVPIPASTAPPAVAAIASHAKARWTVVSEATARLASALGDARLVMLEELTRSGPGNDPVASPSSAEDGVAMLAFTSGSTTAPRAVELTHRNLLADLRSLLAMRRAEPGDAFLSMLPPAHLFELVGGLFGPLACGARVVYAGVPLPNRIVAALREERITHALAVPALLDALHQEVLDGLALAGLLEAARRHQRPSQTVRWFGEELAQLQKEWIRENVRDRIGSTFHTVVVGGAAVDPSWAEVLRPRGIALEVGYGLTEAGPIVSVGRAGECPPDSVGRPLPGIDVRVDDGGEILVRGDNVMRGYFEDPRATGEMLQGGWLHSGDQGHLDDRGFLFIDGRLKEVMVTAAGETLYPEEVEPYYESPQFSEWCVVGLRGPDGNDVPTLVVVVAANSPRELVEREYASLRAAAPARCRVAGVLVLDRPLPRTALGKVRRRALAQSLSADQERP